MDKPISMSVKDFLIRKLAVKMMMSEKTLEAVINHQFQSANAAMKDNYSVEISGFGKFIFNHKKAWKKLEKAESKIVLFTKLANDPSLSEQRRKSAANKLANTIATKEALILKLQTNELSSDLRGMEESLDPCIRYEGEDRGSEQNEDGDMSRMSQPLEEQENQKT